MEIDVPNLLYAEITRQKDARLCQSISAEWSVQTASDLTSIQALLDKRCYRVGLVRLSDGDEFRNGELEKLLSHTRYIKWIALLPQSAMQNKRVQRVLAKHFYDYHHLPVDAQRLNIVLGHAYGNAQLDFESGQQQADEHTVMDEGIVGSSPLIQALRGQIEKVARVDTPVLITGKTGTGKELAAKQIHRSSARADGPFVAVNCAALPASLIQAELFGYEKGAFTGADKQKIGRIESANMGTIFLDEIGDMPADMQIILLRFLEEHTIDRVGGVEPLPMDVRVITATNVDLRDAVKRGDFREDLYYRLRVLHLHMPTLSDRGRDIVDLANHFFEKYQYEKRPAIRGFSYSAIQAMYSYAWQGNVRELMNSVRRALVMSEGTLIRPEDLGLERRGNKRSMISLEDARAVAEKSAIMYAFDSCGNNISHAAESLGVCRGTLYRLMEKHDITCSARFTNSEEESQEIQQQPHPAI